MRTAALLLSLLAAGCATPSQSGGSSSAASLPDFELPSIDGDRVRLSDYAGKNVVVLSFWATWCEPCKSELPHLDRIYRAHKDAGLVVLAIALDDPSTVSQVAPYAKRSDFAFPVLLDANNKASNLYNVHKSAPYVVVIDRSGKVVSEKSGYEPGAETALEAELKKLLEAPKGS